MQAEYNPHGSYAANACKWDTLPLDSVLPFVLGCNCNACGCLMGVSEGDFLVSFALVDTLLQISPPTSVTRIVCHDCLLYISETKW